MDVLINFLYINYSIYESEVRVAINRSKAKDERIYRIVNDKMKSKQVM